MNRTTHMLRVGSFMAIASLVLAAGAQAGMITGIQIPTVVNIHSNSGTTEQEGREAIEAANKLLKQAGFKLVVVKTNNLTSNDAEMDRGERDQTRTDGGKELKKLRNEKGLKINFVKKASAGNDRGISVHRNPTIIIRESTAAEGGAADTGQTIAHELGHVLTIVGHSNGADDVMQATGKGTKFTKGQIAEMTKFENKYRVGKCSSQWSRAYPSEKDKQQFGATTDSRGDQTGGSASYFDVDQVFLTGLDASDLTGQDTTAVHSQFTVGGVFPDDTAFTAEYALGFDTDANPSTGTTLGSMSGADRIALINISGDGGGGMVTQGSILDQTGGFLGSFSPTIEVESEFTDPSDGASPAATSLLFELPKSLMGFTLAEIPMLAAAGDGLSIFDETTDLLLDLERWLDDPVLVTFGDGVPTPGLSYPFAVSGLEPNDSFNLYLNDTVVYTGMLDPAGSCSDAFTFPSLPVNEIHFLTAQDSTGEFAYSITCPEPATLALLVMGGVALLRRKRK